MREDDGTDKANSGVFRTLPRYVEAPTMPRQRQTPCYSSPYRGSKGRRWWRRVADTSVWVSGESRAEQQRAARTRRPFAYFTGNLRASIRQGNCKNGGVIYLSLPLWALSSFPRFPFPSALLLAHVCADTFTRAHNSRAHIYTHTRKKKEILPLFPYR